MRVLMLLLAGNWLGLSAAQAPEKEITPQQILEKALEAHGGKDRLSQVRADWIKSKGVLILEGKEIPYLSETWVQSPGQFKNILEYAPNKTTMRLVQIINKDRVTVTIDGQPHKTAPAALEEIRATLHLNNICRLVPLLAEPETYRLDYTGEVKEKDRTLQGLKVSSRGQREIRLYFDKANGLLVRTEQVRDDGTGKEFRQEMVFLDFRDLGGYKRPVKMAGYRDGKKFMEAELTEVKYHDRFPETTFQP